MRDMFVSDFDVVFPLLKEAAKQHTLGFITNNENKDRCL
jgi:hypothetical protein